MRRSLQQIGRLSWSRRLPKCVTATDCWIPTRQQAFRTVSGRAKGPDPANHDPRYQHMTQEKVHIQELATMTQDIQEALRELPDLPPLWEQRQPTTMESDKSDIILQQIQQVLSEIKVMEKSGAIRPTRKKRYEMSNIFHRLLAALAHASAYSNHNDNIEPIVIHILQLMETWNLDLQTNHVEFAANALGRVQAWQTAADLCWKHIDPELAGYNPVNISPMEPTILYVIARAVEETDAPVVEHVMDAVRKLCMVSPNDQDTYVLAAGTAIGRIGRYQELIDFQSESMTASQLGQALVAAIMRAAMLSGVPHEALLVFQDFYGSHEDADEWQWGGGIDKIHPFVRDLALCSMGHTDGMASLAVDMFRQIQAENEPISCDALHSISMALEKDGNVQNAVDFLFDVLRTKELDYRVRKGYVLEKFNDRDELVSNLQQFLIPIMRLCNNQNEFGLSQLSWLLFACSMYRERFPDILEKDTLNAFLMSSSLLQSPELVDLCMTSLCGLGCAKEAARLFDIMSTLEQEQRITTHSQTKLIQDFCRLHPSFDDENASLPWNTWFRCFGVLNKEELQNDPFRRSWAIASAINTASVLNQPMLGIMLLKWFYMNTNMSGDVDLASLVSRSDAADFLTDELLAAIMNALIMMKDSSLALELFGNALNQEVADYSWTFSSNAAIEGLISDGKHSNATELFKSVISHTKNHDTFIIVAKGQTASGEMAHVMETYRLAVTSGCLSEELAILAMKAIIEVQQEGRMRALRSVVNEISNVTGMKPSDWIESKYWRIKRHVSAGIARGLMFWNDLHTSYLDELEFALKSFEERRRMGLAPRTDVLRCIVNAAYRDQGAARERPDLRNLPRSQKDWSDLLEQTLDEVLRTGLKYNSAFVDMTGKACSLHECPSVYAKFVEQLLASGGNVRPSSLQVALNARNSGDVNDDIRMLLSTSRVGKQTAD